MLSCFSLPEGEGGRGLLLCLILSRGSEFQGRRSVEDEFEQPGQLFAAGSEQLIVGPWQDMHCAWSGKYSLRGHLRMEKTRRAREAQDQFYGPREWVRNETGVCNQCADGSNSGRMHLLGIVGVERPVIVRVRNMLQQCP